MRAGVRVMAAMVAVLCLLSVLAALTLDTGPKRAPALVIGSTDATTTTALDGGSIVIEPLAAPAPASPPAPGAVPVAPVAAAAPPLGGLKAADGRQYGGALAFSSRTPVASDLVFVLVVGSDARPGSDIRRANADSIHLLAVNPRTGGGTVLGFPRDAYVDIPGRGRGKINSALPAGGPGLLAQTVRNLTGLPVHYYVLTGFAGLASMVDSLGGVEVPVDRRMNDAPSGARFEAGLHHFNGEQALAFARNRKDTANGDFSRSANQGTIILAALAKMRAEVGDEAGILKWIDVLRRHAELDVAPDRLLGLGVLARGLDPARMRNLVVPGAVGTAGRQSVVYLTPDAARLFADLRDDAMTNGGGAAPSPPSVVAPTPPGAPTPGPTPPGATVPPPVAPPTTKPPLINLPGLLP